MATVTHRNSTPLTTNVTLYTTTAFTPGGSGLLVFMAAVGASDETALGTATASANSITFTRVTIVERGGIDSQYLFVADQLLPGSPVSMTCSINVAADAGTGCVMFVAELGGMTKTGLTSVKQFKTNNGAAATTPTATFDATPVAGNPQIAAMQNVANPAAVTPPSGFTEAADTGYTTPDKGAEYAYLAAGNTTAAVPWGAASATAWSAIIAEFDASAAATAYPFELLTPTPRY